MDYNFMKNNPDLSKISPEKLNFLMQFAAQNKSWGCQRRKKRRHIFFSQ